MKVFLVLKEGVSLDLFSLEFGMLEKLCIFECQFLKFWFKNCC